MTPGDPNLARRAGALRALLCGATLSMVVLSWPLWIDLDDFPAVPFVRWFPDYDRRWSWLGLALILAGLSLGMTRRLGRLGVGVTIPVMAWLILGDQLRFQPWAYQFLVLGTLLLILPPRWSLAFGRVWMASVYFHSGLSKLDASFLNDMGPLFVRTLIRVLGIGSWPVASLAVRHSSSSIVLPAAEIVLAIFLLLGRTRRLGYVGLVALHACLLLILGPWGLGHSTIVLVWNMALAAEEYVLFWDGGLPAVRAPSGDDDDRTRPPGGGPDWAFGLREQLVAIPFSLLMILPFGERFGLFDSWPSHALYAGHAEGMTLLFFGGIPAGLPRDLRIAANQAAAGGSWELNPTAWTRRVRGVPAYPQGRYLNGLAEWVAGRLPSGDESGFLAIHRLRADPRTGVASTLSARNLKEVRELSETFWFNARPRDRSDRRVDARE